MLVVVGCIALDACVCARCDSSVLAGALKHAMLGRGTYGAAPQQQTLRNPGGDTRRGRAVGNVDRSRASFGMILALDPSQTTSKIVTVETNWIFAMFLFDKYSYY